MYIPLVHVKNELQDEHQREVMRVRYAWLLSIIQCQDLTVMFDAMEM